LTYATSPNCISLPAPGSGPRPRELPDGATTGQSLPLPARASRSARPAKAKVSMIQGTYGRTYFDSSAPSGPTSLWASRLAARLATVGSTECALIWRQKTTPAKRLIYRLSPSMLHSNGPGSTGSPWPTRNGEREMARRTAPSASDGTRGGTITENMTGQSLAQQINTQRSPWPAPTVADVTGGRATRSGDRKDELLLNGLMRETAPWAIPTARDWRSDRSQKSSEEMYGTKGRPLSRQITETADRLGPTTTGSNAPMEKRGAPNPIFACWLMGWSDELIAGVLRVTQLSRRSPRKRSSRSKKSSV
jgi:hypothetical protein